jgi:lysine N6-hydroxylase
VFLEAKPDVDWHPGMLLSSSRMQTPFLADLVTMADPTSPYSFLAWLKETGRLYPFYIRESFFPLRTEFRDYCRWAASRLSSVRFGHHVVAVEHDPAEDVYVVHAVRLPDGDRVTYRGRHVVVGTGTAPSVPAACRGLVRETEETRTADGPGGATVVHSAGYLDRKAALQASGSVTVVGSGQSAAEIYHDLLSGLDAHEYTLTWVTRSPRFFPLEYTKLTLEMTSPEYVDHVHALDPATRDRLVASQKALYKGIDAELVNAIYDLLYERSSRGPVPTRLLTSTAVTGATHDPARGLVDLTLRQEEQGRTHTHTTQGLVLATGYAHEVPGFLDPLRAHLRWDDAGRLDVRRDYSVDTGGGRVFVQNAELHTHGFVTPDLGMGAYRNSCLLRSLLGREVYPVERAVAFQEFGVPADAERPRQVAPA